jgi:hypothetical protein
VTDIAKSSSVTRMYVSDPPVGAYVHTPDPSSDHSSLISVAIIAIVTWDAIGTFHIPFLAKLSEDAKVTAEPINPATASTLASCAVDTTVKKAGTALAARIPIIAITTINSISVNPCSFLKVCFMVYSPLITIFQCEV